MSEPVLLSDEPTVELIVKARSGDAAALEAILQRAVPPVKRWAHGRLPQNLRGHLDTDDLVMDAVAGAIQRLDYFHPQHVGAMQAYLRRSIVNAIRDRLRHVLRRPAFAALPDEVPSSEVGPLELAIAQESYERYRDALLSLRANDRELVVARLEAQWTPQEIAERFDYRSADAARVAVSRAIRRLRDALDARQGSGADQSRPD